MSLRTEMAAYTDGNGLAAPNPVPPGTLQGSDNGCMFESEKLCLLALREECSESDKIVWAFKISKCLRPEDLLCRVPFEEIADFRCPNTQFPPDDLYAIFNAAQYAGNTALPRTILKGAIRHLGFMNNVNPGVKTGQSFLFRQPQLLASAISAAFPSWKNPLHILVRTAVMPLYWVAGAVLATSCIEEPPASTDPRRLAWHLWHATRRHSLAVRIGGAFWYHRLWHDYMYWALGTGQAMRGPASIYYHGDGINPHPFAKYWID